MTWNHIRIRRIAHMVSLICLILIFLASTSRYVSAGAMITPDCTHIPETTATRMESESSDIPSQNPIEEDVNGNSNDIVKTAEAIATQTARIAVQKSYSAPIVQKTTSKIAEVEKKKAEEAKQKELEALRAGAAVTYTYTGSILTASKGTNAGPSGKETYYNLNMSGVVSAMSRYGYSASDYWVRSDGVKMLGEYVMVAANYSVHPKGSTVETSLGTGLVCDTGGFAKSNPNQLDIATNW